MAVWHWYVCRSHEMFLDLDSRGALTRALSVLRRAMRGPSVKENGTPCVFPFTNRLNVESVWVYPTTKANHFHMIVVLKNALPFELKTCWSLWMGADQLRAAYVFERYRHRCFRTDLLASRQAYGFRDHDFECVCRAKHKSKSVTDKCPALRWMLGAHRSADYFPRNKDRRRRGPLSIEWGRISKRKLLHW